MYGRGEAAAALARLRGEGVDARRPRLLGPAEKVEDPAALRVHCRFVAPLAEVAVARRGVRIRGEGAVPIAGRAVAERQLPLHLCHGVDVLRPRAQLRGQRVELAPRRGEVVTLEAHLRGVVARDVGEWIAGARKERGGAAQVVLGSARIRFAQRDAATAIDDVRLGQPAAVTRNVDDVHGVAEQRFARERHKRVADRARHRERGGCRGSVAMLLRLAPTAEVLDFAEGAGALRIAGDDGAHRGRVARRGGGIEARPIALERRRGIA